MDTLYCPATERSVPRHEMSGDNARLKRYLEARGHTEALIAPLTPEDMVVQSMPDASPVKWHLAHTTWFFETFLLSHMADYQMFNPDFGYLFNSYYEALGPRQPRAQRGLLTRPPMDAVLDYRRHVDDHMMRLLASELSPDMNDLFDLGLFELGMAHEEQHQELLCMDVLHLLAQSPLKPAYNPRWPTVEGGRQGQFHRIDGGLIEMGADNDGFAFDNERPRHKVWLEPFEIADRLVTNGEWLEFMADGGYSRADLWLSDGWAEVQARGWESPLYWQADDNQWRVMTLRGLQPLQPDAPVTHISYYEAAAFAHWQGARLPTEAEWEQACLSGVLEQTDDTVWQWTASAYGPYPGFTPGQGAVGEYNGKFMVNQMVLRGGASVTPKGHARPTYRNFFKPDKRWQFSGLRLARDRRASTIKDNDFATDVIAGLSAQPKSLSPKYFYDDRGSELFEAICELPEYYPTRVETALLTRIAPEIAATIPAKAALIEFGSGASAKTRLMLDAAPHISAYVPIDISVSALSGAAARLKADYPALDVLPVAGDFTTAVALPPAVRDRPKIGFFPGSTIGNFSPDAAIAFLMSAREVLGKDSQLIIGADMVKDKATLTDAYDDAQGVTAAFNKNLLARINRELDGDFDLTAFNHLALWNPDQMRIEMHLISDRDQTVHAAGQSFEFTAGERFHTENSHKFTVASFARLTTAAGWAITDHWISPAPEFAVFHLV